MAERSKAPDSRENLLCKLVAEWVFWSTNVGVGSNPTSDKPFSVHLLFTPKIQTIYVDMTNVMAPGFESNHVTLKKQKLKTSLPDGESNPGLPRDRRGYLPLYYRGLTKAVILKLVWTLLNRKQGEMCLKKNHRSTALLLSHYLIITFMSMVHLVVKASSPVRIELTTFRLTVWRANRLRHGDIPAKSLISLYLIWTWVRIPVNVLDISHITSTG